MSDNVLQEGEGGQQHRVPGRDSSGNFKKGTSGNPNGRPKGTGKRQKEKEEEKKRKEEEQTKKMSLEFEAKAGKTVAEAVDNNAADLMNACFASIQKGNPRLTEIFFTQALKDKGSGQNPFAGFGDFEGVSPNEIEALANKINSGDLDV